MTAAAPPQNASTARSPERVRTLCCLGALAATGVGATLAEALQKPLLLALCMLPALAAWLLSDLAARRVTGGRFWFELVLALLPIPTPGLLYLVWTRRLRGVGMWLFAWLAIGGPTLFGSFLGHAIGALARGEWW